MINRKDNPYWTSFVGYKTFNDQQEMFNAVSSIERVYDLPDSVKAVLNTLKLHSQTIFGVCWLKVSEIAKKAQISVRTVHRVLKELSESKFISIFNQTNTKRGGKAPNVYVINPVDNFTKDTSDDMLNVTSDDVSLESSDTLSQKVAQPISEVHSNLYSSSHKNLKINKSTELRLRVPQDFSNQVYAMELKDIPQEFINIMKPYYSEPEIIANRWRTAKQACKYGATDIKYVQWETIQDAWTVTVKAYKLGKVKDATDKGLGGYFYSVLAEKSMQDYVDYTYELCTEKA
jgi:predicted transcriptional regulator